MAPVCNLVWIQFWFAIVVTESLLLGDEVKRRITCNCVWLMTGSKEVMFGEDERVFDGLYP